jgi:transposase-like protein
MAKRDSQWAAIESTAKKLGCSLQTLDKWLKQAEPDT